jgi:hypothetical protein
MSAKDDFAAAPPAKLAVEHVTKWFRTTRTSVQALDDLNLYARDHRDRACDR